MAAASRLDDLLRLLLWEGRLQNARLRELFDLGSVRSSQLIQEFREAYPTSTVWDSKRKSFLASPRAYQGRKTVESADPHSLESYITLITAAGALENSALVHAHRDLTPARPSLFAFLQTAIAERAWARLSYRSMSTPQPHERTVLPSHLVKAGSRWHVRAFTVETKSHRDYNLGRIVKWGLAETPDVAPSKDDAWGSKVAVRLVPHPSLSAEQEDVVRFEYMGGAASRVETTRGALVPYLVQSFRAATDANHLPPEYQLAVHNLEEVRRWLWT